MNVSKNLQDLLDARGWTPERLAVASQDCGFPLTVPAIKGWLDGTRKPGAHSTYCLAKALGCTTDAILLGPSNGDEPLKEAS